MDGVRDREGARVKEEFLTWTTVCTTGPFFKVGDARGLAQVFSGLEDSKISFGHIKIEIHFEVSRGLMSAEQFI